MDLCLMFSTFYIINLILFESQMNPETFFHFQSSIEAIVKHYIFTMKKLFFFIHFDKKQVGNPKGKDPFKEKKFSFILI